MASDNTALPIEIWLQILALLPPATIFKWRMVSRAWNERVTSDVVVDATLRQAGFSRRCIDDKELDRKMRLQMLKGHTMGRPSKHLTIPVGRRDNSHPGLLTLLDDRAICMARYESSSEVTVVNLSTGDKKMSTYGQEYISSLFLTEKLYGGCAQTAEPLFWHDLEGSVSRAALLRNLHPFVAAGDIIAGLDCDVPRETDAVWLLNTKTAVWTNFPIDFDLANGRKEDFNFGFTIDVKFVTIFFLYKSGSYMLVAKRYTLDGTFVFAKKMLFESEEPFTVGHVGNYLEVSSVKAEANDGVYEVRSSLDRAILVDIAHEDVVAMPYGLTTSWSAYTYNMENEEVQSFQLEAGVLQQKNAFPRTGNRVHQFAVNDRWMCILSSKGNDCYLEVFDFAKYLDD